MAPLLSEGFTETCPVYLNSYTVEHEPSLQVFGIGIPLLCLTVFFIFFLFFIPFSSSCYGLWHVCCNRDAATVTQTSPPFYGTCVLDSPRCYLVMLDVGVLLLSSCCLVIAWYIYEFLTLPTPKPQTCYLSPDPLLLVTSSSLRGSPQCIAFQRYCTCQHLTAVQHNVCHAKGVFVQQDL